MNNPANFVPNLFNGIGQYYISKPIHRGLIYGMHTQYLSEVLRSFDNLQVIFHEQLFTTPALREEGLFP